MLVEILALLASTIIAYLTLSFKFMVCVCANVSLYFRQFAVLYTVRGMAEICRYDCFY